MMSESTSVTVIHEPSVPALDDQPGLIVAAGPAAGFAWDEFFFGHIANRHTRAAYLHAVRTFLRWAEPRVPEIANITPGMIGLYFDKHRGSIPTKKLHLSAIRALFDVLVNRHIVVLNPAATVRGERYRAAVSGTSPGTRWRRFRFDADALARLRCRSSTE